MKKILTGILVLISACAIFLLGFNHKGNEEPNTYYQVYLKDEVLGVIKSKKELENYIDKQSESLKQKFQVDRVYPPETLKIKKITTYDKKISSVKEIYNLIMENEPFTIRGYQLTIKNDDKALSLYVIDEDVFTSSVENVVKTFVGKDRYDDYVNENQTPITTTGSLIENVYVEDNITIKQTNIPTDEKIYTDAAELSKFLLFGTTKDQKSYIVKAGDTISTVAFNNQISAEEFLISNPSFTSENSLLFPGQKVTIGVIEPKINVVVEENVVKDDVVQYKTIEQVNNDMLVGDSKVLQKGENGLLRVRQKVQTINGVINYVDPLGSEELQPSVDEIIEKGGKVIPNVGSLTNWTWPTNMGYTISSPYAYRINPFTGQRELHAALDISGTGYGSPVYAANNGTVVTSAVHDSYGEYIVINHNNGYCTLYAHMSKREKSVGTVVSAGTIIGRVGMTGDATGPHLHFEVWVGGCPWSGRRINPWTIF